MLLLPCLLIAIYTIQQCIADEPKQLSQSNIAKHSRLAQDFLPNSIIPRGTHMPLGFYSVDVKDFQRVKDAGCTFVGPYYGNSQLKYLEAASQVGLKFLYSIGQFTRFHGGGTDASQKSPPLDLQELRSAVAVQMKPVLENPALNQTVAWWYIKPEELRHWQEEEMAYLAAIANTIRDLDPDDRPVWMYEPNHRSESELAKTGLHLDVIGKGTYVNTGKTNVVDMSSIPHVWVRWSIDQELNAIRALKTNVGSWERCRTPIAVLEMSTDFTTDSQQHRIAEYVRHDIYLSLISGAKGVAVWSAARRSGFESHDQFFNAYLSTFHELTGPAGLDQALLLGRRGSQLQLQVINGPPRLRLDIEILREACHYEYPSVAHLDVTYKGTRHLFLVNSAEQSVEVRVSGFPAKEIYGREVFGKASPGSVKLTFSTELAPLEVQIWKFEPNPRQALRKKNAMAKRVKAQKSATHGAPDG